MGEASKTLKELNEILNRLYAGAIKELSDPSEPANEAYLKFLNSGGADKIRVTERKFYFCSGVFFFAFAILILAGLRLLILNQTGLFFAIGAALSGICGIFWYQRKTAKLEEKQKLLILNQGLESLRINK